ncbi:hypothetical protein AMTRI_Chr10g228550 [Amborella trichopoda]
MLVEGIASIVENPFKTVPSDLVPYNGKIFSSHNDAYEFYMGFAKAWGRCNCAAHMSIAKVMDSNISYWCVVTFDNLHNHDVLYPQEGRFLPAYRRELPFIDKDIYNYVCAMNNMNRDNDAHILLTKCKQMKDRDKYFKYAFIVGEDNRLEHIVWSHGSCSRAYEIFSDVVVFDTTYRSNGYYMSFGIWMDVNNHGDTCLFGCAFVGLMNGKMPQTILTDQDLALKEAIFNKFALHSNRHINNLWNLKEFWALPYLRSHFFAGLKTTGLVIEMRDVVSQRRLMQQKSNNVDVRTMCPFKDHAAHVLTPYAFSKIQEEIISSFQYLTSRKDDGTYEHSLHVLFKENFIQIPDRYVPKRWRHSTLLISNVSSSTSAAYVEHVQTIQSLASTIGTKVARFDDCYKFIMEQFSRILEHVEEVECMRDENRLHYESIHVKNPARSITKGRPLEKKLKSHVEVAKNPTYCKVPSCGQTGHDYRNCPLRRG